MLGRVLAVSGARMTVVTDGQDDSLASTIGALVAVPVNGRSVVGKIASIEVDRASPGARFIVADFLGEMAASENGATTFRLGVAHYPPAGAHVYRASDADLAAVYARPNAPNIRIGTQYDDETRAAYLLTDELLGRHFAILGSTGSGKSCAVKLILSALIASHPNAHIVLFDPHNEYSTAFGEIAEIVNVDNLRLPLWLLNFEEAVETLVRGGSAHEQEAQTIILKEAITWARRQRVRNDPNSGPITVDTPVPFRLFDLIGFLNEQMGRLGTPDTATPYLRLRTRIESLRDDRRFSFMFSDFMDDTLSDVIARILRIPVRGKPLTIFDLSGVPSEIADVVVALSCRIAFSFAVWSDVTLMPPVLFVCEEAQRYVPEDERLGFAAASRAVSRIATEGRKHGLSLALVTQRPSELSRHALSQCGTIFALRLGDNRDQRLITDALPDGARGLLASLSSLQTRDAVVCGDGTRLPSRIRFDYLPAHLRPRSASAKFSEVWQTDVAGEDFRDDAIRRWRNPETRPTARAPRFPAQ